MKKIYLFLYIIYPVLFISQSINGFKIPDSLKNKNINYIENAYNQVFQIDNEKAEFYANIILHKGKIENEKNLIYDGYYNIARIKNLKGENGHPYADSLIALVKNKIYKDYPSKAYIIKGILYNNEGNYKSALEQYAIALKLNQNENQEQFYYIKKLIAILKTATEEYKEALPLFIEYYLYEKNKINSNNKNEKDYLSSIFSLSNIYAKCKNYQKSNEFADLGIKECKKYKNYSNYYYLIMLKGINYFYLKKLSLSLGYLESVEASLRKNKDYTNLGILYYFIGRVKYESHMEKEAITYFIKSDSISFANKNFEPIKRDGYEIIIDYYKKKGDLNNQLKFIDKLIYSDSIIAETQKNLSKEIFKKYDTPLLIKEKEGLIKNLNSKNSIFSWLIIFLLITSALFIYIIKKYRQKIKTYKKQAKLLLEKNENRKSSSKENENILSNTNKQDDVDNKKSISSNPKFQLIINKIELFEKNKDFLRKNITLDTLSKELDTNRDYLSKLINELKGKNFSQYINELRINYIISELKSNEKIRKYTIAAISEDIGFNNSESFTNAFKKITGTLPSYFIKLLNEENKTLNN
ncbi:helix-turn-helix domain-containing protein [Cloacibacterium sp. TD35]|uniref:helix-turn-helix domain-containing protein n=1 Tax=Cloacibacterium sp. TD35 TaxID=2976818 RepID=UPI00237DE4E6|nr:AraC family transcriptional regulator [Cloacibacterium sp. TD35]WDT67977.1 AraC family transcriptional regulator [Cloacibacterium sp. TD35]